MDGNTLGAMVFLAAGTFLGWLVVKGRAQSFLTTIASGAGPSTGGGGAGGAGASPASPIKGPLAGVPLQSTPPSSSPFSMAPGGDPTVWSEIFGQNGSLYGPNAEGPYGPYSPNYNVPQFNPGTTNVAPTILCEVFGNCPG